MEAGYYRWYEVTNDAVKVIKNPLGGLPNTHIHQVLVKVHGNDLIFGMDIMFVTIMLVNIIDYYTKLTGLCCLDK